MTEELRGTVERAVASAREVERRLRADGWKVAVMDDAGVTHAAVLAAVGRALDFPDHYGQNLDALWDCLTDLEQPTALVWAGWQEAAVADPFDWARIMQVLRERAEETPPPFTLVLCDAPSPPPSEVE